MQAHRSMGASSASNSSTPALPMVSPPCLPCRPWAWCHSLPAPLPSPLAWPVPAAWLFSRPYCVAMLAACLEYAVELRWAPFLKLRPVSALGLAAVVCGELLRKVAMVSSLAPLLRLFLLHDGAHHGGGGWEVQAVRGEGGGGGSGGGSGSGRGTTCPPLLILPR